MHISSRQVISNLYAIEDSAEKFLLIQYASNCCDFRGGPPRPDRLARRNGNKPQNLLRQREEKKNKIFLSKLKANTQYNVVPLIKQIVCTSTEKGEKLY